MAERATPPIRGRRGRDRRLADEAASTLAARHRPVADEDAVDFDLAAVDAEAEDARRAEARGDARCGARRPDDAPRPSRARRTGTGCPTCPRCRRCWRRPARSPRCASAWAARTTTLAGSAATPGSSPCPMARSRISPRRSRSRTRASGSPGSRATPRSATGSPRSWAPGWATRRRSSSSSRGPRWPTSAASSSPTRRRRGSRPSRRGGAAGRASWSPASRRCSSTRWSRTTCRPSRDGSSRGLRLHQDALLRDLFGLGYVPVLEVAGRGEFAKRGGIVDVFPPSLPLPIRIEFFGDEIDSLRAFDPTDQRTVRSVEDAVLLPASEFLLPSGGATAIRAGLGRAAARLPERLDADLTRFEGAEDERLGATGGGAAQPAGATRAMVVGDAAEVWAAHLAPATGLDHLGPGTLLVLDEPGDIAEAAEFLWRQADERRAELIEAGELPKDWPSTYLPSKEWKTRLTGSRTLELTWESDPAVGTAMARGALSSGDVFGWREPTLPFGRAAGVVDAVAGLARRWGAHRARVGPGGAPGGPARGGRPVRRGGRAHRRAATARRRDDRRPEPEWRVHRRPDGLTLVTDRELFGTVRVRRPRALRRVVPRDILERLSPATSSSTSTTASRGTSR